MAELFNMPKFGMTMEEGTVLRWMKQEGEAVKNREVILEIETDKAAVDVEAERDGVLLKILANEGDVLACGEPLAWIGDEGEAIPDGS